MGQLEAAQAGTGDVVLGREASLREEELYHEAGAASAQCQPGDYVLVLASSAKWKHAQVIEVDDRGNVHVNLGEYRGSVSHRVHVKFAGDRWTVPMAPVVGFLPFNKAIPDGAQDDRVLGSRPHAEEAQGVKAGQTHQGPLRRVEEGQRLIRIVITHIPRGGHSPVSSGAASIRSLMLISPYSRLSTTFKPKMANVYQASSFTRISRLVISWFRGDWQNQSGMLTFWTQAVIGIHTTHVLAVISPGPLSTSERAGGGACPSPGHFPLSPHAAGEWLRLAPCSL